MDGANNEEEVNNEFKNQVIRHGPQLDEESSPKARPGSRRENRKEGEKEERGGSVIRHTPSERDLAKRKK
jgi:hypothetical protein